MDIHIGHDRSQPCQGGTRLECPFCDWYLDHTRPKLPDLRDIDPCHFTIRMEWTRVDLICEEHLKDAHADEPAVQRALEIQERMRKDAPHAAD